MNSCISNQSKYEEYMDQFEPKEKIQKWLLYVSMAVFLFVMMVIILVMLSSCQYLPQVADDIKEIANNDAITVKVDKDSFQKETDVHVVVDVVNKEIENAP